MSNSENERRITALEQENVTLRAQLADLAARLPVRRIVAPAPVEEGARISYQHATSSVALPDATELKVLAEIVVTKFPKLGPDTSSRRADELRLEWNQEFTAAFRALGAFGRRDELDARRHPSGWFDDLNEYLHAEQRSSVSFTAFMASLLAWGDIPHSYDRAAQQHGEPLAFGLSSPGTRRPASADSWRAVLKSRQLLAPTRADGARPAVQRSHQVLIVGGGGGVGAGY